MKSSRYHEEYESEHEPQENYLDQVQEEDERSIVEGVEDQDAGREDDEQEGDEVESERQSSNPSAGEFFHTIGLDLEKLVKGEEQRLLW